MSETTTSTENLDALQSQAERLVALLENRHLGLGSWWMCLGHRLKGIAALTVTLNGEHPNAQELRAIMTERALGVEMERTEKLRQALHDVVFVGTSEREAIERARRLLIQCDLWKPAPEPVTSEEELLSATAHVLRVMRGES